MAIVSLDGRPVPPELPRAQLNAIAHRGEWEPSLWEAPGVALGHVNLPRTPEAEREFLPMSDPTGRYWLTWDGRLDNRDELGPKLGYDVTERAEKTDAAYVLDAFLKWGDDCVHRLLGDWAVVIWDNEARRLFCAKDPIGWRQLFFRTRAGNLVVGSEPNQLFAGTGDRPEPDVDYTRRYLAAVMQRPGKTWLNGVSHLAGGETLHAHKSKVATKAYWTQPRISKRPYTRPDEYVDEFADTFERAILARLRSNRPIGVYLSGGIDSSYVAAIATKAGTPVTGITSYVPGTLRADERRYASIVVTHLGIRQREIDVSDCWSLSSDWLPDAAFDGPFHPGQGAHQVRIGVAAKELGMGVIIGGEGGDEWANGPEAFISNTLAHGHLREAWRLARLTRGRKSAAKRLVKESYSHLLPHRAQSEVRSLRHSSNTSKFPERDWVGIFDRMKNVLQWRDVNYHRMEWEIYRQLGWLEPSWRDRHEAAPNGLERRPPFFDLRVIEMLASTPAWIKRFRGRRKDVLREAEYRVLPAIIADRQDWGLFDELALKGLRLESARSAKGESFVAEFTGEKQPAFDSDVGDWGLGVLPWEAWRRICVGLWLANLGVPEAGAFTASSPGEPTKVLRHRLAEGRR